MAVTESQRNSRVSKALHFSIGPVQGFVAQARRTRDLWAGSFLLSWLAGQAMVATMRLGGTVVFPWVGELSDPEEPLIKAILQPPASAPSIGSLPNRFKAEIPQDFDPELVALKVRRQWICLADQVWQKYIEDIAPRGHGVRRIWDRQIKNFWDIQWVIGEVSQNGNARDGAWLDTRKNWRTHWPPIEEGDHCTIMGDWQELSGCIRAKERRYQDAFWRDFQGQRGVGRLDLREGERLCAIALVKRFFPKIGADLENTIGWIPGRRADAVGNWPSTAYMAAVPWLLHIAPNESRRKALHNYVSEVQEQIGNDVFARLAGERSTRLPGLEPLQDTRVAGHSPADLDGNLFLTSGLENRRNTPLSNEPNPSQAKDPDEESRKYLLSNLRQLNRAVGGEAHPFYAMLLMDGDRLGKMLRDKDPGDISRALTCFTGQVPSTVGRHNGVTIYAGGDDVLAMLPISSAVECSIELHRAYQQAFAGLSASNGSKPTASCTIVFTHYHNPFQDVLEQAHYQLDYVAKDGNGRNSLSLTIFLSGGINNSWVANFETGPQNLLELRDQISNQQFSNSFFYNLRQRYELLTQDSNSLDTEETLALLLAEYCKGKPEVDREHCKRMVMLLYKACARLPGDDRDIPPSLQLDGAYIARWLVRNEFGEMLSMETG